MVSFASIAALTSCALAEDIVLKGEWNSFTTELTLQIDNNTQVDYCLWKSDFSPPSSGNMFRIFDGVHVLKFIGPRVSYFEGDGSQSWIRLRSKQEIQATWELAKLYDVKANMNLRIQVSIPVTKCNFLNNYDGPTPSAHAPFYVRGNLDYSDWPERIMFLNGTSDEWAKNSIWLEFVSD